MGIHKFFCFGIACMLLLPLIGCSGGSTGAVSGVVKVDGEPAPGLEVTFTPQGHQAAIALGTSQDGGRFTLIQGRGNTYIPVGKYKVSVTGSPDAESTQIARTIPKQFKTANETPITETVVAGENTIEIDVTTN